MLRIPPFTGLLLKEVVAKRGRGKENIKEKAGEGKTKENIHKQRCSQNFQKSIMGSSTEHVLLSL